MKILKLVLQEASFLKKTLLIIFVILIAFCAALLSVASVAMDVRIGSLNGLDKYKFSYYEGYDAFGFAVNRGNCTFAQAEGFGEECIYAVKAGLTQDVCFVAANGNSFLSDAEHIVDGATYVYSRHGVALRARDVNYVVGFEELSAKPGDVMLCTEIAEMLDVTVGDALSVGAETYRVAAIFEYGSTRPSSSALYECVIIPKSYFYIVPQGDVVFDNVYLTCARALDMYKVMQRMRLKGVDYTLYWDVQQYLDRMGMMMSLFASMAVLMAAMVFLAEFLLFTLILRQRRTQICRFKMLGATDGAVISIYLVICLLAAILSLAIAAVCSVWLSKYMLSVCDRVMGTGNFVFRFRIWLPLCLFAFEMAILLILFAVERWRVSRLRVAEAVKYD